MSEGVKNILEHTGMRRFVYDHGRQEFILGERELDVFTAADTPRLLGMFNEDAITDSEPAMTIAHRYPLAMPRFYDLMSENFSPDISDEAVEVMIDVYRKLRPDISLKTLYGLKGNGLMGFSAERDYCCLGHVSLTMA